MICKLRNPNKLPESKQQQQQPFSHNTKLSGFICLSSKRWYGAHGEGANWLQATVGIYILRVAHEVKDWLYRMYRATDWDQPASQSTGSFHYLISFRFIFPPTSLACPVSDGALSTLTQCPGGPWLPHLPCPQYNLARWDGNIRVATVPVWQNFFALGLEINFVLCLQME